MKNEMVATTEEKEEERVEEERVEEEYIYERTLLYIYPALGRMARMLDKTTERRAYYSYRSDESAEVLVEGLLQSIWERDPLESTAAEIKELLTYFTREELFTLEYCYLRKKKKQQEVEEALSKISCRTFYRRRKSALKKFSALLKSRGMDEQWFLENYACLSWVKEAYERIKNGENLRLFGRHSAHPYKGIPPVGKIKKGSMSV
ncbi:MAG: hypothetical protein J6Z36_00195 [Clostridia bacterium]|nr:hypothetical protein [Clostridia bacterium]